MENVTQFDYAPEVVQRFVNTLHAGSLDGVNVVNAQAGSRESGASARLWLQVVNQRVKKAAFQGYECPHFIAAAESLAEWCEGRTVNELSLWSWQKVQQQLAIPTSKRGRLLILENALKKAIETLISTHNPSS